jgi:hypothetical protein
MMLLFSCRKSDNPKLPELTRFPTPVLTKVAGTDETIPAQAPNSFTGKFTVDMFFKNDIPAQKLDIVVMKNDDKTNIKTLQANVTTFPTTITVTGPQLATLFGAPIVLGDKFDVSADVTTASGVKYEAFPATGNAYASGVSAQPGSATLIRYEAVCKYEPSAYQGNFVVVTDEWADYTPGDVVVLTMIDATHFSFKYLPANPLPIVVTVNAVNNSTSVAKQKYGSGYPPGWTFGDLFAESVPSIDNFVAPCQGIFSVRLKHTTPTVSFSGDYKIVLRKQ